MVTLLAVKASWFVTCDIVGVLVVVGVCAAVIDIGTSWMFDLKHGVCMDAFWLNREQCCWVANDTTFDQEGCTQVASLTWCYVHRLH